MDNALFRGVIDIAKGNSWVSATGKSDSAELLAYILHATARGVHKQKDTVSDTVSDTVHKEKDTAFAAAGAELVTAGAAFRSAKTEGAGGLL